jgi:hypothetical protein
MSEVPYVTSPPKGMTWYILDVMRKRRGRANDWAALLINVPYAQHQRESDPHLRSAIESCWLDIGRCKSRDLAWDVAEAKISTRH